MITAVRMRLEQLAAAESVRLRTAMTTGSASPCAADPRHPPCPLVVSLPPMSRALRNCGYPALHDVEQGRILRVAAKEVWRQNPLLVTAVFVGAIGGGLAGGLLLNVGYLADPRDESLILAGWVTFAVGLLVATASNFLLQRARIARREASTGTAQPGYGRPVIGRRSLRVITVGSVAVIIVGVPGAVFAQDDFLRDAQFLAIGLGGIGLMMALVFIPWMQRRAESRKDA